MPVCAQKPRAAQVRPPGDPGPARPGRTGARKAHAERPPHEAAEHCAIFYAAC